MALNVAISTRRRQSRPPPPPAASSSWPGPSPVPVRFPWPCAGGPASPAREVVLQVSFRLVLVLVLAALGGHLGRKGDGSPGWQTRWLGRRSLRLLVEGVTMVA